MMGQTNYFPWALAAAAGVLAAVGMLALITLVVVSEPAGAAFPGQNGKIAFESNRAGSNDEIYTMNANGQGVDRLTNNAVADNLPAWSPDGNKIVFMSNRDDPRAEIYTMNANGQGVDRLTNNGPQQSDSAPAWQSLSAPSVPKVTAPKVTSTVPKAHATGVAPAANITATFSADMMTSTINETTFKLLKKGSTTRIAAAVGYSAAPYKATLNPTNSLRRGVTYQAVVTNEARDTAGNPLAQQYRWFFTVR